LNSQGKQLGKERVGGVWKGKLWDGRGASKVEKRSRNLERLRSGEKKEGRWVGGREGNWGLVRVARSIYVSRQPEGLGPGCELQSLHRCQFHYQEERPQARRCYRR